MPLSAKNPLSPLYRVKSASLWPTLAMDAPIPDHLASQYRTPGVPSRVGLGVVQGICSILCIRRVSSLGYDQDRWSLSLRSSTTAGVTHHLGGTRTTWFVEHTGYLMAACALTGMLTVYAQEPDAQEVVQRYAAFVRQLEQVLGAPPPYSPAQLPVAATNTRATEALMSLCDAVYFYAKRLGQGTLHSVEEQPDPVQLPATPGAIEQVLYLHQPGASLSIPPTPVTPTASGAESLSGTVRRLIARGGTALLFGPTSGGKSTAVRRAAVAEGTQLIIVRGRPNLDDKQLYGGLTATADGLRWVDGPLTEVWRLASEQRVVLLIDELLRFDPYYLNALVGALDRLTGDEVRIMPRIPPDVARDLHPQRWYYLLDVPNGDRLVAPADHLSIIATTNVGPEYLQASQIDTALLNRFQLRLAVDRLPRGMRVMALRNLGISDRTAQVLADVEDFSLDQCGGNGGLLQRPLTLRTVQDWALEAMALVQDAGASWGTALVQAAEYTIIPYACPWLDSGAVESAPAQVLREYLTQQLRSYQIR